MEIFASIDYLYKHYYTVTSFEMPSNLGPSSCSVRFIVNKCCQCSGYFSLAHFSTSSFQYWYGMAL